MNIPCTSTSRSLAPRLAFGLAVGLVVSLMPIAQAQAAQVSYYSADQVPDPAVVADILGQGRPATRMKMRGRGDYDEPAAAPPAKDTGLVYRDDVLTREQQLSSAAHAAVQGWRARLDARAEPTSVQPKAKSNARSNALAVAIGFANDSAQLQATDLPTLDAIAEGMRRVGFAHRFVIEGHTSASGSAARNLALSRLRADSVKRYLVTHQAIPAPALQVVGMGSRSPLDAAHPNSAANRRVQFRAA